MFDLFTVDRSTDKELVRFVFLSNNLSLLLFFLIPVSTNERFDRAPAGFFSIGLDYFGDQSMDSRTDW